MIVTHIAAITLLIEIGLFTIYTTRRYLTSARSI